MDKLNDYFKSLQPKDIDYSFGKLELRGKGFEIPFDNNFRNHLGPQAKERVYALELVFPDFKWERVYVIIETNKKKFNWKKLREDSRTYYKYVIVGQTKQGETLQYEKTNPYFRLLKNGEREAKDKTFLLVLPAIEAIRQIKEFGHKKTKLKRWLTSNNRYLRILAKKKLEGVWHGI